MFSYTAGFFYVKIIFVNPLIVQNNIFSRITGNTKVFQEGSSVLVRVISDKGNGKYEGSIAGNRITLNSKTPLKIGSTFVAAISTQNGTLQIIPKGEVAAFTETTPQLNQLQNEQLVSLLKSMGLPADQISLALLKQMQQLDMKLDFQALQRFHNLAAKFKGKEKSASQLLVVLLKKGLSASDEEILKMLMELDGDFEQQKENAKEKDYKLINKVNRIEENWSFYPFELIDYKSEDVLGNGCIKLLLDKYKQLKILNVNCNCNLKEYYFNLDYVNRKLNTVHVNIFGDDEATESILEKLKTAFKKINADVKVVWEDREKLEGTAASLQEIYTFRGAM